MDMCLLNESMIYLFYLNYLVCYYYSDDSFSIENQFGKEWKFVVILGRFNITFLGISNIQNIHKFFLTLN